MAAIVVTFVLVIDSLISCVMVGGFTFGLIGAYVPPAEVTASEAMCSSVVNLTTCQLTLTNQGTHSTATTGVCSIGGASSGSVASGATVPAGGSLQGVRCEVHGSAVAPGSNVQGAVSLTNGATLVFFGTVNNG